MHTRLPAGLMMLLILLGAPGYVLGESPASLPVDGALYADVSLESGIDLGVYGPRPLQENELAFVTLRIVGREDATGITSGFVMLACPEDTIELRETPAPEGSYLPYDQAVGDDNEDWRPLLVAGRESLWAFGIAPMAHTYFQGTAGDLLQAIVFEPGRPKPGQASAFRNLSQYDRAGVAFIVDESITRTTQTPQTLPTTPAPKPARGVRIRFPILVKDPSLPLGFWVALNIDGEYVTHTLAARITPATEESAPVQTVTGAPVLDEPPENTVVEDELVVAGTGKPGTLAVAWIETSLPGEDSAHQEGRPIRRITDADGWFEMTVPVHFPTAPGTLSLQYELHVRTEAPGYQSPATIRRFEVRPQAPESSADSSPENAPDSAHESTP